MLGTRRINVLYVGGNFIPAGGKMAYRFSGYVDLINRLVGVEVDVPGSSRPSISADIYPNPFSNSTRLEISSDQHQHILVALFDPLGRRLYTLFDGELRPSTPERITVDGSNLAAGTYFIRVAGDEGAESRKILVTRYSR